MKTIIVIESVDELLRFANRTRAHGDTDPMLPQEAFLEIEADLSHMQLLKAPGFQLQGVSPRDLFSKLLHNSDLKASIDEKMLIE